MAHSIYQQKIESNPALKNIPKARRQLVVDAQVRRLRKQYEEYFNRFDTGPMAELFFDKLYTLEDKAARDELTRRTIARAQTVVPRSALTKINKLVLLNDITDYLDLQMALLMQATYGPKKERLKPREYRFLYSSLKNRSERQLQLKLLLENFENFYRFSQKKALPLLMPAMRFAAGTLGAGPLFSVFYEAYAASKNINDDVFYPFFNSVCRAEHNYLNKLLPP